MNCRDCLNYEACRDWDEDDCILDGMVECRNFKDKSRFVEVPANVGDTVYVLSDYDYNEMKVTHILIGQDGIPEALAECPVHSEKSVDLCEEDYCGRGCCRIIFSEHNDSRIRFTKEEAEKALAEREEK